MRLVLLRFGNKRKYVNMADIISPSHRASGPNKAEGRATEPAPDAALSRDELYWYVEALFFAYREFTSEPDRILEEIGFGRAHHRVLHFVHRYPGLRVADLLDVLQITKQSLARVLRELIGKGYISQRSGKSDRRERRLYATEDGAELARRLAAPQLAKLDSALARLDKDGNLSVARFLSAMVSDAARMKDVRDSRDLQPFEEFEARKR
ncbi:MAG: MarR family transcriptional regulator [Rhodomicrobium sp.]|nr:MarR family transcriptional regulator [Rhodomicrobium sp.]